MTQSQVSEAARTLRAGGENRRSSDSARLLKARADEREAKAAHAALELKIQRGEFVPRSEVEDRENTLAKFFQRWALGLETELPPRVVGLSEKEIRVIVRSSARNMLTRAAKLLGGDAEDA